MLHAFLEGVFLSLFVVFLVIINNYIFVYRFLNDLINTVGFALVFFSSKIVTNNVILYLIDCGRIRWI